MNSLPNAHRPDSSTLRFRQSRALRHLPGQEFVHGSAPSSEPVDEGGDELALSGVTGLGLVPEPGYLLRYLGGVEGQPLLHYGQETPT